MDPILLVHGGAGDIPAARVPLKIAGCKRAVTEGYKHFKNGCALDAVEAAIHVMEDDPAFNAGDLLILYFGRYYNATVGYGSVLNFEGEVEMDASIMTHNLNAGAVSIVKDIAHPISLARKVMEKTPHVILSGEGAKKFAIQQGFPILPKDKLVTGDAMSALADFKKHGGDFTEIGRPVNKGDVGTVGAIAIDRNGMLVAATSTGGICGKMVGRCSDTSQIGSGTYANKYGAVSTTGYGEAILKFCLAHTIIKEIENGKTAQEATTTSLKAMKNELKKTAGAITISKYREVGIYFTSNRMSWAYISNGKLHYGIEHDQHVIADFSLEDN
ncbi:hypothetical protein FQA39_LY03676 [Lamprigera yunnana]|nr:hypothetical protein FQA39_LY03676 [Lamprigera yunnana]